MHARPLRGRIAASDGAVVSLLSRPPWVVATADFVAYAIRVDVAAFRACAVARRAAAVLVVHRQQRGKEQDSIQPVVGTMSMLST